MKRLLGLLAWCLLFWWAGCATGGNTRPRDNQEGAVWAVWVEGMGRSDRPPAIRWMEGDDLDCIDPQSGNPGFTIIEVDTNTGEGPVRCREGFTMRPDLVQVAWRGQASFADTTMAHEFAHVALIRRGVYLNHHGLPAFWQLVDAGNRALIARGL